MRDARDYLLFLQEMGVTDVSAEVGGQVADTDAAAVTAAVSRSPEAAAQTVPSRVPVPQEPADPVDVEKRFCEMAAAVQGCTACALSQGRNKPVFGEGSLTTDLMFVGEGPGYDEDQQGIPFVGKAGQLLTRIIEAIELSREDVYITNIVKCRPPRNRDPLPEEVAACGRYLEEQIRLIRPKVICTLGRHATQSLLNTTESISRIRGRFQLLNGIKVMPTYHPAYLLRNPAGKRDVWQDVQKIRDYLKENSDIYEKSSFTADPGS